MYAATSAKLLSARNAIHTHMGLNLVRMTVPSATRVTHFAIACGRECTQKLQLITKTRLIRAAAWSLIGQAQKRAQTRVLLTQWSVRNVTMNSA